MDYVNDRFQSDVFILSNHQVTGGVEVANTLLQFTGREIFTGVNHALSFVRQANATDDEGRQQMVQTLKLGLVKYLARTEPGKNVQITFTEEQEGKETGAEESQDDPWNLWVFNARLNGNLNGDKNYFHNSFITGFSASRVTSFLMQNQTTIMLV